jgi:hypothetical protein
MHQEFPIHHLVFSLDIFHFPWFIVLHVGSPPPMPSGHQVVGSRLCTDGSKRTSLGLPQLSRFFLQQIMSRFS